MTTHARDEIASQGLEHLADELDNFQEIVRFLRPSPGEIPRLAGIDVGGVSRPLHGSGGDHLIYIDFNARYNLARRIEEARRQGRDDVVRGLLASRLRAGILVTDVSGHRATDALVAAMLHQVFLVGARYELDIFGEITTNLFEHINMRFYRTSGINRYLTMLYGEMASDGTFRFITAGHPPPAVFSPQRGTFARAALADLAAFPPVGVLPSGADLDDVGPVDPVGYKKKYRVNQMHVQEGEIILLATDGFLEHAGGDFYPERVAAILAEGAGLPAAVLRDRLGARLQEFSAPVDDVTFVLIKKTA